MDINNLKHVVGQANAGEPAIIRFFDSVTEWSTKEFNEEFLWLQNVIKPSKIIVMINSEGGSVMYGMSTFSVIQSCPIEVECVIEGIAASMGSVIWAAGDNLYMHDYSLLMIHNPFDYASDGDESTKQMVSAFRTQLETIYQKRFGMTKSQVQDIMNGQGEADGTFFTAKEAVKAGFLDKEHVIATSKQVREKVKNQIDGVADKESLRSVMSSVLADIDENKLLGDVMAIHNRKDNQHSQESKVMENQNFDAISAQLGFSQGEPVANVSARIAELIKAENNIKAVQDTNAQLEIKLKGAQASLANATEELQTVKASLKKYQDAEAAAFEAKVADLVEAAIKEGKIEESSKESWIKLAHDNFDTVKATLDSINGREDIPNKIANDSKNEKDIQGALEDVEAKEHEALVARVCGGKVEFKTF